MISALYAGMQSLSGLDGRATIIAGAVAAVVAVLSRLGGGDGLSLDGDGDGGDGGD